MIKEAVKFVAVHPGLSPHRIYPNREDMPIHLGLDEPPYRAFCDVQRTGVRYTTDQGLFRPETLCQTCALYARQKGWLQTVTFPDQGLTIRRPRP